MKKFSELRRHLMELRHAPSKSMLAFHHGKAVGFVVASGFDFYEIDAAFRLIENAVSYRTAELSQPTIIRLQAA